MEKLLNLLILAGISCLLALEGCSVPTGTSLMKSLVPSPTSSSRPNPGSVFHFEDTTFTIFDQPFPASGEIKIDTVFMDRKGFIVVLRDDNYIPGEFIASSSLLEVSKEYKPLVLKTDPARLSNRVHITVAFDEGDGIFNFEKDEFLRDAGGFINTQFFEFRDLYKMVSRFDF